jgi:hypothetical protein
MEDSLVGPLVASLEISLVFSSDSSSGLWLEQLVQESHEVQMALKSADETEHSLAVWSEAWSGHWLEQPGHSLEQPEHSLEQPEHWSEQPEHWSEQPGHW